MDKKSKQDKGGVKQGQLSAEKARPPHEPLSAGIVDHIAGEAKSFVGDLKPHLPQDLIGGSIPHVPGTEEQAVWNAASQACGTERVHYVYTVEGGRVWYLACPSQAMASHPDSWCPLAAALPGNSEYWDKETVYLYEQEGLATALRWDPDTGRMQVFLGASRTILPRVQSMDANFVTINAQVADIVPWHNRTLRTEQLSRAAARVLLFSGMVVSLVCALLLLFNYFTLNLLDRNLTQAKRQADEAANKLLLEAAGVMHGDTVKHIVCIQGILDDLAPIGGTLVRYEVGKNGKFSWEALIPDAFAQQFGRPLAQAEDGRVRVQGNVKMCR